MPVEYDPIAEPTSHPVAAPPTSPVSSPDRPPARGWRRWGLPVVVAVALGVVCGIAVAAAIHMPRVETLSEFTPGLITQLYDRNGQVFSTFARERRVLLREGEVPEVLRQAIIAAEDQRFLKHGGIDALGVGRAALKNLLRGRRAQGASTLTMQLARELFLTREKKWSRKIEEALLAVELEKRLSKEQILTFYCNLMNLGHGNYGMEAAARDYFNKSVAELTLVEAATLAGIPQRPSAHNPYRHPDLVVKRRNEVLRRMAAEKYITGEQYAAAIREPLLVVQRRPQSELGSYFAEEVRRRLETSYGASSLYDQGLQVRTTLDATLQRAAEEALRDGLLRLDHRRGWRGPLLELAGDLEAHELPSWSGHSPIPGSWYEGVVLAVDRERAQVKVAEQVYTLDREGIAWTGKRAPSDLLERGDVAWFRLELPDQQPAAGEAEAAGQAATPAARLVLEQEPQIEGAVLVIESATGAIRAMVGGWDFQRSKFNRATQARRQVGSAFKPFAYAAALEMGYTPADTLFDAPAVFLGADAKLSYSPRNYYRKYYGILTLRRALELSVNVTSVKLLDLIGVERVIDLARRTGIRSDLPPYPSLALGSADLVPLELAAAYATFANQGVYVEPYLVDSVATADGHVLEQRQVRAQKAMEPQVAYVLTAMLEGVVDRGTAAKARALETDLAGKTGTTDDYSDAWFVGYTPRYTVLTWVGHDVKRPIGRNMTGAEAALPIWLAIVSHGLENGWIAKHETFTPPPGVVEQPVEYYTGFLPGEGAARIVAEAFVAGTQPVRMYEPKWAGVMSLHWAQQRPFYTPKEGERMPEGVEDWDLVREKWATQ